MTPQNDWEHRIRELGRIRLHTVEAGPAPGPDVPLVVLLHGFPETWYGWRYQIPALAAAGFRVVAPDQRGYGGSERPRGARAYRLDELAADVRALVEDCGAERAHVVGHDWGAAVAWWFAMHHADRLARLAILNVPHPQRFATSLLTWAQLRRSWYVFFFQLPLLPEWLLARNDHALLARLYRAHSVRPDAYDDVDVARNLAAFRSPGALTAAIDWYRALFRENPLALLGRQRPISAPVLVIWGEQDRALGAETATPDPRRVPHARVEFLPDAGHFVQADRPERVSELLVGFLREDRARGAQPCVR